MLPGRGYPTAAPLLHITSLLLQDRGWTVREVQWEHGDRTTPEAAMAQATHELAAVTTDTHLVVAKSLGTLALPAALDRDLPGVWLTPLTTRTEVAAAVRALTAPSLLVGGTADDVWDSGVVPGPGAQVLEVEGANHSLEVGTDPWQALVVLRRLVDAVAALLERVETSAP